MVEVTTYDVNGRPIDSAECDLDVAQGCARTLWNDSIDNKTGVVRALVRDGERVVRVYLTRPS